ncbi:hypothetical protein [Azospirillum canadense]|uniref:hypothetical protein n=1 Tax=Azospirillum canadense TaxID=403962 RepID=UPI0022280B79|nr:hypothetical protein [Azospirillum canadense]MCW2242226.1 hypothetical protein [Azospirillum canadense]
MTEVELHPVQTVDRKGGKISKAVTLRAYEVYKAVYGPQEAMITGGCRGGFSTGELIAFLYAHSFPKSEWGQRVDEALRGKVNI